MTCIVVNRLRRGWLAVLVVCLATSAGLSASTSEISISTQATGTARIEMPGLVLSGTLTGKIRQSGFIISLDQRIDFEGTGNFVGTAYRDLLSLKAEAWAAYDVKGSTSTGQAIELRGLLYLYRVSESLLRVGEILTGPQYVVVTLDGSQQHFLGSFSGSFVQGGFVLPEVGMFLALAGEASFVLSGGSTARPQDAILSIPLPSAPWSRSFADYLRTLFSWLPWPAP